MMEAFNAVNSILYLYQKSVLRNRAILPRFRFQVPIFFSTVPFPVLAPVLIPVQVPVPTLKF
jgi:hypothetical protein